MNSKMYIQFRTNWYLDHYLHLFNSRDIISTAKCYLICCNCNKLSLWEHERGCRTPWQGHNVWCSDHVDTGDILVHWRQNHLQKQTMPLYNLNCCWHSVLHQTDLVALAAGMWKMLQGSVEYATANPCGGRVEYLHRDPANRKRRWNGAKKCRAIA
jgi:hypothetical protein